MNNLGLRTSEGYIRERGVSIVRKYTDDYVKFISLASVRKSGYELEERYSHDNQGNLLPLPERPVCRSEVINDHKLANNLSRAKQRCFEIAICNKWDWFFTGTLSPDYPNRFNLDGYIKDFGQMLRNYNKRFPDYAVRYLLVPEQQKSGAWHLHGLLTGICPDHLYLNRNGYRSWKQYDRFGFLSLDEVKTVEGVARYITKYVTKETGKGIDRNKHSFYCSKGLKKSVVLGRGQFDTRGIAYDFQHEKLCKVKNLNGQNSIDLFLSGLTLRDC